MPVQTEVVFVRESAHQLSLKPSNTLSAIRERETDPGFHPASPTLRLANSIERSISTCCRYHICFQKDRSTTEYSLAATPRHHVLRPSRRCRKTASKASTTAQPLSCSQICVRAGASTDHNQHHASISSKQDIPGLVGVSLPMRQDQHHKILMAYGQSHLPDGGFPSASSFHPLSLDHNLFIKALIPASAINGIGFRCHDKFLSQRRISLFH